MGCAPSSGVGSNAVTPLRIRVEPNRRKSVISGVSISSSSSTRVGEDSGAGTVNSSEFSLQCQSSHKLRRLEEGEVFSDYDFDKKVGSGASGFVYKAFRKPEDNVCAVKTMATTVVQTYGLQQEAEVLAMLDHPNIVKLYDAFEDHKRTYLVMEFCEGGELLDRVQWTSGLPEQDAAIIIRQILCAIDHMHGRRVCHRDVKPENFLFSTTKPVARNPLKAVDFGLARMFRPGELFTKKVGTALYMAPEVLREKYDYSCDLWSCGCLLYVLLCGVPPFHGDTEQDISRKILRGRLWFPKGRWGKVSSDAQDLITKLVTSRPMDRWSASQGLEHGWVQRLASTSPEAPEMMARASAASSTPPFPMERPSQLPLSTDIDVEVEELRLLSDYGASEEDDGRNCSQLGDLRSVARAEPDEQACRSPTNSLESVPIPRLGDSRLSITSGSSRGSLTSASQGRSPKANKFATEADEEGEKAQDDNDDDETPQCTVLEQLPAIYVRAVTPARTTRSLA